jgi:dTDP-4-amino-4,6-dideoxygalactose transaminase
MINSKSIIPYGSQKINQSDFYLIKKSLNSSLITTGPYVQLFEQKISRFVKSKYAITCNSGTSALHLSYLSIGIKKGDVVILPAINFVAAANMALSFGAKVYFSDVDFKTGQSNPTLVENCIKKNNLKKVKAIIVMYNGGFPRNIIEFYKLKKKYKCYLIEDACHAFGANYKNNIKNYPIGSCRHSDISTFSFHPLKTITTGEGGAVTTNNRDIAKKLIQFRSHGIIKNKSKHWVYNVGQVGYNYRLSDLNAALGISQLKNIKKVLLRRKEIFNKYINMLDNYMDVISIAKPEQNTNPAYHLVLASINFDKLLINKNQFIMKLLKKKIICQFHYIPNYEFDIFKSSNSKQYGCDKYKNQTISLPIHLKISKSKQEFIIKSIKSILKNAKKIK